MRNLALSDEILLSVDKAARYIGGEVNSIMKDKDKVTTRVAFSFPDVFDILFPSYILCWYIVLFSVILFEISVLFRDIWYQTARNDTLTKGRFWPYLKQLLIKLFISNVPFIIALSYAKTAAFLNPK